MRQLMRQHRLLLIRLNPVQQVHRLRLVVVEPRNLLRQQRQQKRPQMKVAVQQAELLQHDLRPLHPLRALVLVELLLQIAIHLIARDQFALHADARSAASYRLLTKSRISSTDRNSSFACSFVIGACVSRLDPAGCRQSRAGACPAHTDTAPAAASRTHARKPTSSHSPIPATKPLAATSTLSIHRYNQVYAEFSRRRPP